MPTTKTVIGTFDNPSNLDIFQILGLGGSITCGMDYTGLIYPTAVPVIQKSLLAVNTNAPQSVTNLVTVTSLYNIAIYMESSGDGGVGTTCVATIAYTNVQGSAKTVTLTLGGNTDNIQQENYVLLAGIGTSISVSTAFSGAAFHYDLALAIAILPT
jgi:hypothetical protein